MCGREGAVFSFGDVEFEAIRHSPSGNVERAVGYKSRTQERDLG